MRIISGADGCKLGWVVISKDLDTGAISWRLAHSAAAMAEVEPRPLVLAVDIPIGLPESGARSCDLMARELLGPIRGASVFPAPIRRVLAAKNYTEASRMRHAVEGKKMSKQAWAIVEKIRDVDTLLREEPSLVNVLREIHPEVSFWTLSGGSPVELPKRTWRGMARRIELLSPHFGDALEAALDARRALGASPDDILDAFAALWSAQRICEGNASRLPAEPDFDSHGLPMHIWH